MQEVYQLLSRIKNLKYFEVSIPVPPFYVFNGKIPFNISIENELAICRVLAETQSEADKKVHDFFHTN